MENEQKRTQVNKETMIEALEVSLGIVTEACNKTGLSRTQHYKWYNEDEDYKQKVDSISNKFIDFAETHLKKQIESGSVQATTFFLRTRGRKRGYNEKQEIDLTSGEERIKININLDRDKKQL
jgi:predicted DNA-binding transcriptional regulator AlpA|tara:strand:- start:23347 stop:23715 length:369 start_codon:yes stop_codon:yes gene_type:complete